ncbi:MAG: PilZ domain-containing protein [Terriglobales bacterium]
MSMGNALLVSDDSTNIHQLSRALGEVSIRPDLCREVPEALRLLHTRKFDAVIVDSRLGTHSASVLEEVRTTPSNRTAVTFAIGSVGMDSCMRKLSSFVFDGPISSESVRRTLRAAYGLVLRERRRYFRCPICIPVLILKRPTCEVRCHSINISEGGLALNTAVSLKSGELVQLRFALPGRQDPWTMEATVCWEKVERIGVRFASISPERKTELQEWLARKLEEQIPDALAETFNSRMGNNRTNCPAGLHNCEPAVAL